MGTSLLQRGENAIVIFTYGKKFNIKRDRSGSTGNWVLNHQRKYRKVVIYERTTEGNDVYVARRAGIKRSNQDRRYVLFLKDVSYLGTTYLNWPRFSGSRNPIRYWSTDHTRGPSRSASHADESAFQASYLP
jgi:hypothetical protein